MLHPPARVLRSHSDGVTAVAMSADGQLVLSGSWDKTLKVWDAASGCELRTLAGHAGEIDTVAMSANGRRAVSGSFDQTIRVWDLETGRCLATFTGESPMKCCACDWDARVIVAGEESGRIHFLQLVLPDDPLRQ